MFQDKTKTRPGHVLCVYFALIHAVFLLVLSHEKPGPVEMGQPMFPVHTELL